MYSMNSHELCLPGNWNFLCPDTLPDDVGMQTMFLKLFWLFVFGKSFFKYMFFLSVFISPYLESKWYMYKKAVFVFLVLVVLVHYNNTFVSTSWAPRNQNQHMEFMWWPHMWWSMHSPHVQTKTEKKDLSSSCEFIIQLKITLAIYRDNNFFFSKKKSNIQLFVFSGMHTLHGLYILLMLYFAWFEL